MSSSSANIIIDKHKWSKPFLKDKNSQMINNYRTEKHQVIDIENRPQIFFLFCEHLL